MSAPGRPSFARGAALIAIVLALGVFFRFHGLEWKLLWHDEMATRVFAAGHTVDEWKAELFTGEIFEVADVVKFQHYDPEKSVVESIRELAEDDPQHPPLYYVLARVWVGIFGDSIGTLRALSAFASLFMLAGVWWLARELFSASAPGPSSSRIAWTAVALFAVSPFFVLYAQEAREYALWAAFIVLSNASLLRAIRLTEYETPRLSRGRLVAAWALYSFATVVALYTSFTTASLIIAQLIFLCVRERLRPTRVAAMSFVSLSVSALLLFPWAFALYRHLDAFQVSMKWSRIIVIPRTALVRILAENFSRTFLDFGLEIDGPAGYAIVTLGVAVIALALVTLVRRAPRHASSLLVLIVLVPVAMLFVPDLLFGGIRSISMRYLTSAWVAVLLALSFLLGSPSLLGRFRVALPAAVFAVAIASCALAAPKITVWTKGTSVRLPEVADAINASPSPLVVGNLERHNPGNLMALAVRLKPGTHMQFLDAKAEEKYVLPRQFGSVFLFTPIDEYRRAMETREGVHTRLLMRDIFLDLWKVEPGPAATPH